MKNSICAIIITYKIGEELYRCFDAIYGQVDEVVIVDNGSNAETLALLKKLEQKDRIEVFYNQENLGIAAAQNIGIKYAIDKGFGWVLTLDHDSVADEKMVENMLWASDKLKEQGVDNVGIIAANLKDINVETLSREKRIFGEDGQLSQVRVCVSSGSLINVAVFSDIGFFTEKLFLYYVDDDFCLRCGKNWKLYSCRTAVLNHREGARQIKQFFWKKIIYRNYAPAARYYICRNAIYMFKHHYCSASYCLKIMERVFTEFVTVLMFDEQRWKLLGFMVRGIFDGVLGRYGKLKVD